MTDTLIDHVSDTAFWIAHYRALETQRPDALFKDPLAGLLAGDRGEQIARAMPSSFITSWSVVVRTCIIDNYLRFAIAQGVDAVLNLGAGLDTRPYRMDLPQSLVWVEADYPDVIEFKEKQLLSKEPRCHLTRVKLDLANLFERRQMFANLRARASKVVVLTEGVIPYLSAEAVGSLADDLRSLEGVCYWIVDYFSPAIVKHRQRLMKKKMQNAPFKFKPEDWFGFFGEHGWRSKEIRYLVEEGNRLRRPLELPPALKAALNVRGLFASNERRAAFGKFAGYVMLEPKQPDPVGA